MENGLDPRMIDFRAKRGWYGSFDQTCRLRTGFCIPLPDWL